MESRRAPPLLGRGHHLDALESAFAASHWHAVTVLVHGAAGMGTTTLLRGFVDGLADAHQAVVLSGRSTLPDGPPYKTLATVFAAKDPVLASIGSADLTPSDVSALTRIFPGWAVAGERAPACAIDHRELRRRACAALRALLARLATRAPIVLAFDDLQWADADSTSLLLDLIEPPDPPPLLLLAGYRSEYGPSVGLAAALHRRLGRGEPAGDVREVYVGPLSLRDARALARVTLASAPNHQRPSEDDSLAASIARLSGGSPFLVHELLHREALPSPARRAGRALSAVDFLVPLLDALPSPARRLLELIAVAGEPTRLEIIERAAELDDPPSALAVLEAERLVVVRGEEVEPVHDLFREAALARVDLSELGGVHLRLAGAHADPDARTYHLEAAGEVAEAGTELAADRAADVLAWHRAVDLYSLALGARPDRRGPLLVKLGQALTYVGRGADAGRALLDACEGAPPGDEHALRLRATVLLLHEGCVDGELSEVREVLAADGVALPRTRSRARASLLYRRARLALRGLGYEACLAPPSASRLAAADACWTIAGALQGIDDVWSADLRARHLLTALDMGDLPRVARALSSEAITLAGQGAHERAGRILAQASAVAERCADPYAVAWAAGAAAGVAYHGARFAEAVARAEHAIHLLRAAPVDVTWELCTLAGDFLLPALYALGRLDELALRLPAHVAEAERRGAAHRASTSRALFATRLFLMADRPAAARREVDDATGGFAHLGWHAQRWCAMVARVGAALYLGDGPTAHEELEAARRALEGARLMQVAALRVETLYLRGLSAIAAVVPGVAERSVKALGREDGREARPLSRALAAASAAARGDAANAAALFDEAERGFAALEMDLHAAAARRRRAEIVRGDEGLALFESADAWMRDHGASRPDRIAAMLMGERRT